MAPPTGQAHLDIALAVLCTLGGAVGYIKKRSAVSLIAGVGFGVAYGSSAYLIQNVDAYQGHVVGASASALLTVGMGMRFAKTKKFMPAGLLASVGLLGLVYHSQKAREWA